MDNKTLKRNSRIGALLSAIGFMCVIIAFVYSFIKLKDLNEMLLKKTVELERIDSILVSKDSVILVQNDVIEDNKVLIDTLINRVNRLTDSKIHPKARAVMIPGLLDSEHRQIYDFTVWISSSNLTLSKIRQVSYQFKHNTFLLHERESTDMSNGFLVSYRGWGCLSLVVITVQYDDGKIETIYFNMCNEFRVSQ